MNNIFSTFQIYTKAGVSGLLACLLWYSSPVLANSPEDSLNAEATVQASKAPKPSPGILSYLKSKSTLAKSTMDDPTGLKLEDLMISGVVRFLTIYRTMDNQYSDMITSSKNISFTDYPLTNVGANNNGGFPMLELTLSNSPKSKFNFGMGYSFASSMSGLQDDNSSARIASSRSSFRFSGKWTQGPVRVGVDAGFLWTRLSRFTMGQPDYRDSYFDRLPWDWYRKSYTRYEEYYMLTNNIGAEGGGRSPILGYMTNVEIIPLDLRITAIYGRTNRNVNFANSTGVFPGFVYAGKVEKTLFTPGVKGKIGVNFYRKQADTDRSRGIADNQQIISTDFALKIAKINFVSEIGYSTLENPGLGKVNGAGVLFRTEFDKKITRYPFSLEYYNIGVNMASLDGSIINSNYYVRDGGYSTEFIYDNMMLMSMSQEVGQIANNRQGVNVKADGNVGKLKISFGIAASQELDNMHDTITFQHRVNAFTRSRFRPWFQAGGEYSRIKSSWLRTFETITITDSVSDYKKGFNGIELLLKYKSTLGRKSFVIMNFNSFNSATEGFSPIPTFGDKAFIRTFYEDITLALQMSKRITLVGNTGFEISKGNRRTQLADANGNTITNTSGQAIASSTGNPIDQFGYAIAGGIDYDFSATAGLHLRHKYFHHKDKYFTKDIFSGHETYLELKIFF